MANDTPHGGPTDSDANAPFSREEIARQEAIKQIERRRHFWTNTVTWFIILIVAAVIWVISEYNNADGWPTKGFSESSGTPHVWNYWIIYPFIAWVLFTALGAWNVYGRRPISESDIEQEMQRQAHRRR